MFKQLIIILLLAPIATLSADISSIDGIWQDVSQENTYYSFYQDGNTIIMIDLRRLGASSNTFSATYIGSIDDLLLTPLAPFPDSPFDQAPLRVNFISDKEATILPECDVCIGVGGVLMKIFK